MGKKKVPLFFPRSQNVRSMETIKTIDSSLHYHNYNCVVPENIRIVLNTFHFCYRSIAIIALILRLIIDRDINVLLKPQILPHVSR